MSFHYKTIAWIVNSNADSPDACFQLMVECLRAFFSLNILSQSLEPIAVELQTLCHFSLTD